MPSDQLIAAAARVDIMDTAGRILADPERQAVQTTKAEVLALAWAAENFWSVCVEAELLVNALAISTEGFTSDEHFALRDHTIQTQADAVSRLMAALGGTPIQTEEEKTDANRSA